MNESSAPAPSASSRRTKLGEIALFGLLWVTLMQPLRTLAPSLDSSWQMMLGYARDHGLVYGRDLIPTMGPAGFLFVASPAVHHLGLRIAWMLLGTAVLAAIFWSIGRRLHGFRRAAYFAFLLLVVAPAPESMQGLALLILGLFLLRVEIGASPVRTAAIAAAVGVLSLFKFTHFTLALALVACATAYALVRRHPLRAAAIVGGFTLGFVGGWKILGQPLSALPDFLRLSADVSSGYVDAMSIFESPRLFWWGIGALIACGHYARAYWRNEADRPRAHATVVMLAAAWFLNWKHGYVRADGHTLTLFIVCLFPALAFPFLLQESDTPCKRRAVAVLVFMGLCGIWTGYAPALTQSLATFNNRLVENVSLLSELRHPHQFAAEQRAAFAEFGRIRRLPRITALVGNSPIDVLGTEQAMAMFDDFHYTPRPVFQNYYAFTPRLARLNEAFYASPKAPQFVVQKYETIDNRVPGLDDARTLALLYTHYALIAEENGWLLWEKVSAPRPLAPSSLKQETTTFGRTLAIPENREGATWVQVDVELSLLGKLQALLYKPPQLTLKLTDAGGATQSYRLVRAMAGDGFLLQPFFPNQAAVSSFFSGHDVARVKSLEVSLPAEDQKCFSSEITVTFSHLPLALPPPAAPATPADPKYRMFSQPPIRVTSPHPAGPYVLDGHEVFFIHAPGEIEFDPDMANTHLSGAVAMPPAAYSETGNTDGIELIIEHVSPTGRHTVLWQRTLDPAKQPADRGLQHFSVALPGKGRVLLKNLTGPKGDPTSDWTLWADLRFD